ncbi:cache domain-containing protein [Sphingomonas crusticola]|uniref:cache domain-containing protein n=1 Tax=Sphingomonas crusticola TaxID=1697973 RepID=UPI000E2313F8|nr:cache domain-containing protein [Sphingomonas crusticola]
MPIRNLPAMWRNNPIVRGIGLSFLSVLLVGLIVSIVTGHMLHRNAEKAALERVDADMRVAWDVLRQKGAAFRVEKGSLMAGGFRLNGNNEVVDKIKRLVASATTVFQGDERISTTILKSDGQRAIGTRLAAGPVRDAIFAAHRPYRGKADVLGEPYMTAYDPIRGRDGKVIGILFVGVRQADYTKPADAASLAVIIGVLLSGILSLGLTYVITKNSLQDQARKILDMSPVAVAIVNEDGDLLYVNDAAIAAFYHQAAKELLRPQDLYADPGQLQRLMAQFRAEGEVRDVEVLYRRSDGSTFWALVTWQKLIYKDQPAIVRWIYDVSERKAAELAMAEARDLAERTNQTKSEFLANMSHELRTPLNAIIGYAELLQEDMVDAGLDDALPDLKKIEAAGKHLLELINEILDLSKIEAGRMEAYLEPVSLPRLIEEIDAMARPLATTRNNQLEIVSDVDAVPIRTDYTKLKQSLLNLISNACKFTQNGVVRLEVERGAGEVRFRVSDTGIGMTEEQTARLFQAFTQADASTTREYGGSGLGLAITKRFCQLLGGDVTVESVPGQGSTFTIVLPLEEEGPSELESIKTASTGPSAATLVLLVDDDPQIHHLVGTMLSREGYRVEYAGGGAEAIARARSLRPAVILLDVMMPQVDGWTVLTALKAEPELAEIPIVIISLLDERPLGLSLGAAEFLTKPVDRKQLIETVRAFAGGAAEMAASDA